MPRTQRKPRPRASNRKSARRVVRLGCLVRAVQIELTLHRPMTAPQARTSTSGAETGAQKRLLCLLFLCPDLHEDGDGWSYAEFAASNPASSASSASPAWPASARDAPCRSRRAPRLRETDGGRDVLAKCLARGRCRGQSAPRGAPDFRALAGAGRSGRRRRGASALLPAPCSEVFQIRHSLAHRVESPRVAAAVSEHGAWRGRTPRRHGASPPPQRQRCSTGRPRRPAARAADYRDNASASAAPPCHPVPALVTAWR